MLTNCVKRDIWAALDDQLVVDVTADKAVRERPHGVGEDVSGDSLHDVLDELGTDRRNGSHRSGASHKPASCRKGA